jgi:hypothetical protein
MNPSLARCLRCLERELLHNRTPIHRQIQRPKEHVGATKVVGSFLI